MSRKLQILERVRHVRLKRRDAAAAAAAEVEAEEITREHEVHVAGEELEGLLVQAGARLEAATEIRHILELHAERDWRKAYVDARKAHAEAVARGEKMRQVLRGHERDLRVSEKLIERVKDDREDAERREEQRATDDIVASRSRG